MKNKLVALVCNRDLIKKYGLDSNSITRTVTMDINPAEISDDGLRGVAVMPDYKPAMKSGKADERWQDVLWIDQIFKVLSELKHQCLPKVRIHEGKRQFQWTQGDRLSKKIKLLNDKDFEYQVVKWFVEITEALSMLERRGIVHGDINPGNIVIDEKTNRPVLIDWSDEVFVEDVSETIRTIKWLPAIKALSKLFVIRAPESTRAIKESENFYSERFRLLLNQNYPNMNDLYTALKHYQEVLQEEIP